MTCQYSQAKVQDEVSELFSTCLSRKLIKNIIKKRHGLKMVYTFKHKIKILGLIKLLTI